MKLAAAGIAALSLALCALPARAQLRADGATASFRGSLPPRPVADLTPEQEAQVRAELDAAAKAFAGVKDHPRAADAEIFLKAVRYALEYHEWYDKKPADGQKKALALLAEARKRIDSLAAGATPWMDGPGRKVLGFYSQIDGSPQPYGIEVPEGLEWGGGRKPVPMWIWLHGRGDTSTDLHFIYGKLNGKAGQFQPGGAVVVHPFGRYCNGWKSAGETDVFECRDDAAARFQADPNRIALMGFSMGGAGAWHIGAHFADQWAVVHTGAGFVDVKRYQNITPDKMPPWYEEKLWGVYDVPDCARNFFNVPLISYSGENDRQRDSAEYMEDVLAKQGYKLTHLIGPGMEHKYHPEVLKQIQAMVEKEVAGGRNPMPKKVTLQTRTLQYPQMFWVKATGLKKSWEDSRIDAELGDDGVLRVKTVNVASAEFSPQPSPKAVEIDGDRLEVASSPSIHCVLGKGGKWQIAEPGEDRKHPGQSGPMDEIFKQPFLVVMPEGKCASPAVDAWVKSESAHFAQRWPSLMRGGLRVKTAGEVTDEDIQRFHLVLWGDAKSNSLIKHVLTVDTGLMASKPFEWTEKTVRIGGSAFPAATHVPLLVYPNPLNPAKCVVLNSGLTFRESHDRTNSLQNPKLPDWAILDITTPPDTEHAGKVVAADFFDETWQPKK